MCKKIVYFSAATPEVFKWFGQNDYSVLFSFYGGGKEYHAFVDSLGDHEYKGHIFIDSGAFSARNSKKGVDIEEYAKFINETHERVETYANLDVMLQNMATKGYTFEQCCQMSYGNFVWLTEHVCPEARVKLAAVYHAGEPASLLDKYLDWYERNNPNGWIAMNVGVNHNGKVSGQGEHRLYAQRVCNHIKARLPNLRVHLLGYNHIKDLPSINCDSSDSTGYAISARYGHVICPYGDLAISHRSKESESHPHFTKKWGADSEAELKRYFASKGWDYEKLIESTEERAKFNAWYAKTEIEENQNVEIVRKGLF